MTDRTKCEQLAGIAVGELARRGIAECRARVASTAESSLEWRDGALDSLSGASSAKLEVALFLDGRYTVQSTGDLREREIARFLDDAVAFLRLMPADPCRSAPDPSLQGFFTGDLAALDPSSQDASLESRRETLASMYDRARAADPRVIDAVATSGQRRTTVAEAYGTGFAGSFEESEFSLSLTATALAPDGSRPNACRYRAARRRAALPPPGTVVDDAIARAISRIGQRKLPSGRFDLVLRNDVAPWAIDHLVVGLNGWSLDEKRTIYAEKRGSAVASSALTLIDDPTIKGGLGSRPFDEDGFPARRQTIVDRGVLENYYIGWYYSRKLSERPTTGNRTNAVVVPGDESLESLIAGIERGILVECLNGGNSNPATGDFSVGVSGFLVEKGRLTEPVHEMVAAGNVATLLHSLDGVGNDPDESSPYLVPSLRFRDVTVSGT